ncbi:hypothetical protein GCM10010116_47090 [Microbispora rosea subsp. aerata]|nr:hypothetical protein GCM10010116_47090 [Microbispora rosea subsp. aerata]
MTRCRGLRAGAAVTIKWSAPGASAVEGALDAGPRCQGQEHHSTIDRSTSIPGQGHPVWERSHGG